MDSGDFESFSALVQGVHSFYEREASEFALDVWWQTMRPFDLAAVKDAFGRHTMNPDNGQFLPKPADVVKMMEGSTLDSSVIAWTKVTRAVQSVGTYSTVVFDDPIIHAVIADMGGWPALGLKRDDEWPFVAKEFQQRYRGYKTRRAIPDAYPAKLLGILDTKNNDQGYDFQRPVLIGNAGLARQVLALGSQKPLLQITQEESGG